MLTSRQALVLLALTAAAALPASAAAEVGHLRQLPGKAGCVRSSQLPKARGCARARFISREFDSSATVAVSPDGRNLYLASAAGTLSTFAIKHGRLHQLRGRAGCIGRVRGLGCARLDRFQPLELTISPDGRSVYVSGVQGLFSRGGLVAFARNTHTGALRRLHGTAGCLGTALPGCSIPRGLAGGAWSSTVSPDGRTVYVSAAGPSSSGLGVFTRKPNGSLRQLPGAAGCLNQDGSGGCSAVRGPFSDCCSGIAVSPDSRNVYVASDFVMDTSSNFGLLTFGRDTSSGALTQLAGASGCVFLIAVDGCATAPFDQSAQVYTAAGVAISPNGRDVYLAHESGGFFTDDYGTCGRAFDFTALFTRDPVSGAVGSLRQDVSSCGSRLVVPRDGRNIYTVADDGAGVGSLTRDRGTGLLTFASCIGDFWRRCRPMHRPDPLKTANPGGAAVTPDGRYVYMIVGGTLGIFARSLR